ncbi:MAG: AI-2E family transporter [Phycisphaerales bacterium]
MAPEEPSPKARWSDLHIWQVQYVRDILMILGVLALFWLGQKLSIVTVPVLLAILFAYLFEPVIQFLMRRTRLKRHGAVTAILVAIVLGIVVPGALALSYGVIQGAALVRTVGGNTIALRDSVKAAQHVRKLEREIDAAKVGLPTPDAGQTDAEGELTTPQAPEASGVDEARSPERIEEDLAKAKLVEEEAVRDLREQAGQSWVDLHDWLIGANDREDLTVALDYVGEYLEAEAGRVAQAAAGVSANAVGVAVAFLSRAFGILFMLFLTAFFFYFFATGWVEFKGFTGKLLPDKHRDQIVHLATRFDRIIAAFIRGRLTIAFIQAIVFTVGYWIIGVPASFILGPVVAILSIVPYMALVGVPVAIVLLWLENHTGIRGNPLYVLGAPTAFYFFAQALDDYIWTPMIQGKETGMSTPAILFASLAGGVLFGVFGLLIAIPIAACLKILIQEVFWPKFRAWAEGEAKDFLPIDGA